MSNVEYVTFVKANEPRKMTLAPYWLCYPSSAEYRYMRSPCPQGKRAPYIASDILRSWVIEKEKIFLKFSIPDTFTQPARHPSLGRFRLTAGDPASLLVTERCPVRKPMKEMEAYILCAIQVIRYPRKLLYIYTNNEYRNY